MTSGWIETLLTPSRVIRRRPLRETAALRAGALLMLGRLEEYDRAAEPLGLPKAADALASHPANDDEFILRVLALLQSGQRVELAELASFEASADHGVTQRVLAAVFLSIGWSAVGRPDLAIPRLMALAEGTDVSLVRALVRVHLGVRLEEIGANDRALDVTRSAIADLSNTRGEVNATVMAVARRNEFQLAWLVEHRVVASPIDQHSIPALSWIEAVAHESLSEFVQSNFKAFFDDPYMRTISMGVDQTDRGLRRALFRAETLGDRQLTLELRGTLGRYRLLTEAGRSGASSLPGLLLLKRARDAEGLARALRVFRAAGPLEALRAAGRSIVGGPWLVPELHADLELIAATGFTLDRRTAAQALDRLFKATPDLLKAPVGGAWLGDAAFDALAGVASLLDTERQNALSAFLRRVANDPPSPRIHQAMSGVLHAVDWRVLDPAERKGWLSFVRSNLRSRDDRVFAARIVALELLEVRERGIAATITSAYERNPSLLLAPLLLHVGAVKAALTRQVTDEIIAAATQLRENAHSGKFGLGGANVGSLLGRVAATSRTRKARQAFVSFVQDSAVPIDERVQALQALFDRPRAFPSWVKQALGAGIPPSQHLFELFGTPTQLAVANLRMRALARTLPPAEALSAVVSLSSAAKTEPRALVSQVADEFRSIIDEAPLATVLLDLAGDPVPVVRGYAGRSLASISFSNSVLERARAERVAQLLREPGELVPGLTWQGVSHARFQGRQPSKELLRLAKAVSAQHLASTVREAAQAVLGE